MIADLFVREDLSKLENRINVALFGLLAVARFHEWLVGRLGFFAAVVIYPTTNVVGDQGSIRPDFVVKHAETEEILAWIEVECWRDDAQLARFRSLLRERVIAIWGRTGTPADLGLDEIAAFLDAFDVGGEHPQVRHNLAHLRKLIGEVLDGAAARTYKPMPVADAVLQTPFVRALRDALGVLLSLDVGGPMRPGEIRANTRGERGFLMQSMHTGCCDAACGALRCVQSGNKPRREAAVRAGGRAITSWRSSCQRTCAGTSQRGLPRRRRSACP